MRPRDPASMGKLDAHLLAALNTRGGTRAVPERVNVAVVFTGELAALRAAGFEAPSLVHHPVRRVNIAAGSIAPERLAGLAALGQVISVESGRGLKSEIDDSVPEIGARIVHQGVGFIPSTKGRGVVIGIVDSGVDFRHGTFLKPDGRTRMIALWDQVLHGAPGNPPSIFGYGIEYLGPDLDGALGVSDPTIAVRTVDGNGHGTHVAGIAAGNGSQPGNCHFSDHFVGVAPEADLIVVRLLRREDARGVVDLTNLQQALEYIFTHPLLLDRPVVVNCSQGDNLGPHDGTSTLETVIDALVLGRPGRAVVKSAGNEGASGRHAEIPVPTAGADLQLRVGPEDRGPRALEAWYPGQAQLAVQVFAPGVPAPQSPVVAAGDETAAPWQVTPEVSVVITSQLHRPQNGDNVITVIIDAQSGVIPANTWTIRFSNTGPGPTTVHAWLDNEGPRTTQFLPPHVSTRHTITTPGTAKHVITVGAYDDRTSGKEGKLAPFTSQGPVRRLVAPQPGDDPHRPDLIAPGVGITSAKRDVDRSSCCDCCVTHYTVISDTSASKPGTKAAQPEMAGTSLAAPHVTGVVALMLERNQFLSADTIRQILRETAAPLEGASNPPTEDELNAAGHGRVNALAAVERVVPPLPGGGGPVALIAPPGGGGSHPTLLAAGGECPALAGLAPFRPALAALRRHVLSTPDGQLCAALVSRHFSEARGLIRANRRVAVAWHRATGPAFVRHVVRSLAVRETDPTVAPARLELTDGFARFLAALARYGSAQLRSDLDRYGPAFASMVRGTLHQIPVLESAA